MVTCIYSVKGGAGTTTFAAITGIATSEHAPCLVIDLCGDLPGVFGIETDRSDGIFDWLRHEEDASAAPMRLSDIETAISDHLSIVTVGNKVQWCSSINQGTPVGQERFARLATSLLESAVAETRTVLIDAGTLPLGETFVECWAPTARLRWELALRTSHRLLVTRACYLALRAVRALPVPPTDVALLVESGRALQRRDVEAALGIEVGVTVAVDPAIARCVDAGVLAVRLPRGLRRAVGQVAAHA